MAAFKVPTVDLLTIHKKQAKAAQKKPAGLSFAFPALFHQKNFSHWVIAIELSELHLKVAFMKTAGPLKKDVVRLMAFQLGSVTEDAILERVRTVMMQLKVTNPYMVGVLPSQAAITRNIEVPSRNINEIREIVNLQAGRHTPYSRSEVTADYLSLGIVKNIYTRILLVIVPRTVVKHFYNLADKMKLKVEKILFGPELVARLAARQAGFGKEAAPDLLAHVARDYTEFLVLSHGLVSFIRSVPFGATQFAAEKETSNAQFVEEIKRTLEAYQAENIGAMPARVVLEGLIQDLGAAEAMLPDQVQMPVKRWLFHETPSAHPEIEPVGSQDPGSFIAVTAATFFCEETFIDLTPEEGKLRRSLDDRIREVVKTAISVTVCLGLVIAIFLSRLYFMKAEATILSQRAEPIRKEAESLQESIVRIETIHEHLKARGRPIECLAEIHSLIPDDVYLSEIRYEEDKKFTIKGTAVLRTSIYSFVDKMEGSPLFSNVEAKFVSGRTQDGKEMSDFEIGAAFS